MTHLKETLLFTPFIGLLLFFNRSNTSNLRIRNKKKVNNESLVDFQMFSFVTFIQKFHI